jgi:hypothetical protein
MVKHAHDDEREFAQLIATSALLPVEKRAAFVQRVVAALAAGETSLLNAIAVAQRGGSTGAQTNPLEGGTFSPLQRSNRGLGHSVPCRRFQAGLSARHRSAKAAAGRRPQTEFRDGSIGGRVEPRTRPEPPLRAMLSPSGQCALDRRSHVGVVEARNTLLLQNWRVACHYNVCPVPPDQNTLAGEPDPDPPG